MTNGKRRAILGAVLALGLMAGVSIALPLYQQSEVRVKETQLKQSLFTLRSTIDRYQFNTKKLPAALNDLVSAGYLETIPVDPMTGTAWRLVRKESGIFDVSSGSHLRRLDGTAYSSW